MARLANRLTSKFGVPPKDARKSARKKSGSQAWIRSDGEFAVRPCTIADLSGTGVRLILASPQPVSRHFNLLLSRGANPGRRCHVKWQRGTELGAEFV